MKFHPFSDSPERPSSFDKLRMRDWISFGSAPPLTLSLSAFA
jgi:hypothetical protein